MSASPKHNNTPLDPPAIRGLAGDGAAAFDGPRTFNRDLSWLEFNRRVLAQAADDRVPLLERVRFLSIFSSNLDEFFMKRVGLIRRQMHAGVEAHSPDGLSPRQQLVAIRKVVLDLQSEQALIYTQHILPDLAKAGIFILRWNDLVKADREWVERWYRDNVFPALTPLAVDAGHRFPFISNLSENLGVLLRDPRKPEDEEGEPLFARVKIPGAMKRYVQIAPRGGTDRPDVRLISLDHVIKNNLDDLFPGMELNHHVHFRVTRSAGIQRDDFETVDLLQSVEEDLKARKFARAVRLEIEPDPAPSMLRRLQDRLNLDSSDVYELQGLIEYNDLSEVADLDRPDLKHKPWRPVIPRRLIAEPGKGPGGGEANFFAAIRKQDILLHHPYESFHASVERFIRAAAEDPAVVAIKQTLYRTSPDSPFIESLIRAAESGKTVACLVELRARFDESRNVKFARQLERAGVHVAYGVVGLKTHCKTSLVVRKERNGLRCYAHIGTGNYHPKTAQLYTDVGLLTCDPGITSDLVNLFNYLTGYAATQSYQHLLVAPVNMRDRFNQLIDNEIAIARRRAKAATRIGVDASSDHPELPPHGRMVAKINSLEDPQITEKLYEASAAGVRITLIVRGFCCLRPGVPGLSENIRVVSIVGRFLEHSRIFHFGAGAEDPVDGEWYISSADWMYRNLTNRVEAACPVRSPEARRKLQRIIEINLDDHRQAWDLLPDGEYAQRHAPKDAAPDSLRALGTFGSLMAEAEAEREG
jgi:polyphosphate kinase